MSLTFPAAYSAKLKSNAYGVRWLFHFKNNNASYVYICSGSDHTVGSNRYYGIVQDPGEITKDLDLINCKASIGEVSISCVDVYKNGTLSGELLHNGTDYYINQEVKIYECLDNESTLANCAYIYEGRLKEVDIGEGICTLVIEQWTPFDHIEIPYTRSLKGVFQPIAYGDFEQDIEENFFTSKKVFPCPFEKRQANKLYFVTHEALTGDAELMYYDSKLDKFLPITSAGANTESSGSVNIANVPTTLARTFRFRPVGSAASNDFSSALQAWDSESNITGTTTSTSSSHLVDSGKTFQTKNVPVGAKVINTTDNTETTITAVNSETDLTLNNDIFVSGENYRIYIDGTSKESSYAFYPSSGTHSVATSGSDVTEEYSLNLEFVEPTGKFTALRVHAQATVTADYSECSLQPNNSEIDLVNNVYSKATNLIQVTAAEISGAGTDYTETRSNLTEDTANNIYSEYVAANYVLPSYIELIAKFFADYDAGTGDETIAGYVRVHDVYLKGTVQLDFTNEAEAAEKFISDLEYLYCGADGLDADFTDGSGNPALSINEVHRDIMDRYAGVDYDNDYMANWSSLVTARSGWDVRMWLLEPAPLKEILEKLQFEGCFIFALTHDSDGSGNAGGRYIYVKDDPTGDVVQTFTQDDIENLNIGHTDVYEIITKTLYRFNRHPALDRYLDETSYGDTEASRSDVWNLGSSHFESIDLDFLIGSKNSIDDIYDGGISDDTPNESIALYRDNLQSEPKIMLDFDVINKNKTDVEFGDIIKMNVSHTAPYGETWSNLYFMIVSERRSKMGLSLTCREVYRS